MFACLDKLYLKYNQRHGHLSILLINEQMTLLIKDNPTFELASNNKDTTFILIDVTKWHHNKDYLPFFHIHVCPLIKLLPNIFSALIFSYVNIISSSTFLYFAFIWTIYSLNLCHLAIFALPRYHLSTCSGCLLSHPFTFKAPHSSNIYKRLEQIAPHTFKFYVIFTLYILLIKSQHTFYPLNPYPHNYILYQFL